MTNDQKIQALVEAGFTFRITEPDPGEVRNTDWNIVGGVIHAILAFAVVMVIRVKDDGEEELLGVGTTIPFPVPDPGNPGGDKVVVWSTAKLFWREGPHRIFARVVVDGDNHDTPHQTFTISQPLGLPVISNPEDGQTIHTRPVRVSGRVPDNSTFIGVTVKAFLDQDRNPIGEVPLSSRFWSIPIDIPPDAYSITAQSFKGTASTGRTEARLFYVAPLALESVEVDSGAGGSSRFSGDGLEGAMVKLTVVSGPDVDTLPEVQVTSGKWEIIAPDWPLGSYTLKAIQKVSNRAGGWIESLPFEFTVERGLPDPTDVKHTLDYQPTFTGNGFIGATVRFYNPGGTTKAAPDAVVGNNGQWLSQASDVWGATRNREVHIKQYLDDQESPNWLKLNVNIPPQQPSINPVSEIGLLPKIEGGCDPGATAVRIKFSNAPTSFNATVTGTTWYFQSTQSFVEGVVYIVEAIQTVVGLESEPASRSFSVYVERPRPTITDPENGEECDSDLRVVGGNGMRGASMQLWDARDEKPLGDPKVLSADGEWFIYLVNLKIDDWFITARQTLSGRPSEHSDIREFKVVVLPPEFSNPLPGASLPRTSTLSGWGRPYGRVTVWCKGVAEPVLRNVLIDPDGGWKGDVTLEVGEKVFWGMQVFGGKTSKASLEIPCRFVPHAVLPESPIPEERLGKTVTVSGFAVPGDEITLKRGAAVLGQTPVLSDRTWSITTTLGPPDGTVSLSIVASNGEFHSAASEWVSQLGLYLPEFTEPEAGRWGLPAMRFAGLGKPGSGTLMSWYSPDVVLAAPVPVTNEGWTARSTQLLAEGAQWCRFWQTFSTGTPISDCSESGRFDVRGESPDNS